jgi:VWFA-related protein
MNANKAKVAGLVCLLATVGVGLAQESAAPRLVTLHVIATDPSGHPVTDLKPDELQVTDQGKAQSIGFFRSEATAPAAPLAAGEFSNRAPANLAGIHIVRFDLLNLDIKSRRTTADHIIGALEHLENPANVYLYLLSSSGELVPVRGLPDGSAAKPSDGPWTGQAREMLETAMGPVAALRPAVERDTVLRIKMTYTGLQLLAGRLARFSGRKQITWITMGVPRTFPRENGEVFDCLPQLRETAGRLAQANVALDPVPMLAESASTER